MSLTVVISVFSSLLTLFSSLSLFPPPSASFFLCPSFPLGRQPCALEALRDETTHWSCSRGQKKKKKAPEKALPALPAKTPARNQSGCGETVKLLKETAAKPQETKNREGEESFFFIVLQNKQSKMVFVKEFMILKSCQWGGLRAAYRDNILQYYFFSNVLLLDKYWSRIRIYIFFQFAS